jgi:PKD repeat protein
VKASDEVRVTVLLPNQPPVAEAGEDVRAAVGEGIVVSGSGSDSDGSIVSYGWKEGDTVLSDAASFSYTPTDAGTHTLTLTVTDDDGAQATDTLSIESFIPNQPPVANAGPDRSVEVNHTVTLSGSGSDSDGSIVSYIWKEGEKVLAESIAFAYIPQTLGAHTLTLTVTDDKGATHSDIVVVNAIAHVSVTPRPQPQQPKPPSKSNKEVAPSNWYIRLVAEDPARNMKTASTQLGVLEVDDAAQKHTLKSMTPFGGSYLDVVFRNPSGVKSGDYKVNFHPYREGSTESWEFTVRTDDTTADILLTWRGLYVLHAYVDEQNRRRYREYRSTSNPLIKNMKLVDVESGMEVAAVVKGKAQTYSFNMNGAAERTFRWVVEDEPVTISAQNSKFVTLQAKAVRKDRARDAKDMQERKAAAFDLSKPPRFKEEMPTAK